MIGRGLTVTALAGASLILPQAAPTANALGSPASLADGQAHGASLGQSISISSDETVAVIGEPNYNGGAGAALVYTNLNGTWSLLQPLTAAGELALATSVPP